MKPNLVADEMFPEGAGFMDLEEAGGSGGMLMDLDTNEKHLHADFYNDFDDLYDEDEENGEANNIAIPVNDNQNSVGSPNNSQQPQQQPQQ